MGSLYRGGEKVERCSISKEPKMFLRQILQRQMVTGRSHDGLQSSEIQSMQLEVGACPVQFLSLSRWIVLWIAQ